MVICLFITGCFRYRKKKTRKHAILGMIAGTVVMTTVACVLNAWIFCPLYGIAFGMPVETFVEMEAPINGLLIVCLPLLAVGLNLLKGLLVSGIVLLLYKRIRVV